MIAIAGSGTIFRRATLLLIAIAIGGCDEDSNGPDPSLEAVMPVGSSITLPTGDRHAKVTALSWNKRRYEWDHEQREFTLEPRLQRWYGSLGLFLPNAGFPDFSINAPLQEFQMHHSSLQELERVFSGSASGENDGTTRQFWNPTGLEVDFGAQTSSGQLLLHFDVIQHCVNGRKPSHLPGADHLLILRNAKGRPIDDLPCHQVGPDADYDKWSQNHPDQK